MKRDGLVLIRSIYGVNKAKSKMEYLEIFQGLLLQIWGRAC